MSEQKPAWESLEKLQAFPTFQDQAAAAAANAPGAKEYIANNDERNWYDPDPDSESPFKVHFEVSGVPWVMYRFAFAGKMDSGENGILSSIAVTRDQAGKVNIKPSGTGMTNVPGTGRVVPVPLTRDLLTTEKLRRQTPFSPFEIRNLDVALPSELAQKVLQAQLQSVAEAVANLADKVAKIAAKLEIT